MWLRCNWKDISEAGSNPYPSSKSQERVPRKSLLVAFQNLYVEGVGENSTLVESQL